MTEAVNRLFQHMSSCSNRELLYDLYAYLWDIRGVISLLNSYIKWLGTWRFAMEIGSQYVQWFRETERENLLLSSLSCVKLVASFVLLFFVFVGAF